VPPVSQQRAAKQQELPFWPDVSKRTISTSPPTALAVRACAAAGLTLVAIAREDSFEVFTHAERICAASWRSARPAPGKKSVFPPAERRS
jgi:FdhD/NarQ family